MTKTTLHRRKGKTQQRIEKGIMVTLKISFFPLFLQCLVIFPRKASTSPFQELHLSVREELMASIGYLPNCSTFSIESSPSSSAAAASSVGFTSQRLVLEWKSKKRSVENPVRFRTSVVSRLTDPTVSQSDKGAFGRREVFVSTIGFLSGALWQARENGVAVASEFADMPAIRGKDYGKSKMKYPDYTETESGLQYKDLRLGNGPTPKMGEIVVVDWDGYTIGYYGRIFEARNKTKGGSFEGGEKEFFKFKLGSQQVIPAFEEAIVGMAIGGVRRIVVPPELGYPEYDYNKKGPQPTTFSGQRALDFVLKNQGLIDKTLLFDIELLKIVSN